MEVDIPDTKRERLAQFVRGHATEKRMDTLTKVGYVYLILQTAAIAAIFYERGKINKLEGFGAVGFVAVSFFPKKDEPKNKPTK
jgi:hypothetical protein